MALETHVTSAEPTLAGHRQHTGMNKPGGTSVWCSAQPPQRWGEFGDTDFRWYHREIISVLHLSTRASVNWSRVCWRVRETFLHSPSAAIHLPDRESEISWVALTGSSQKAAMDTPGQEQLLCLNSADVGMKPPAKGRSDM